MNDLYIPGQFKDECDTAIECYREVNAMLERGSVDEADIFMAKVMLLKGRRIYETVLTMIAITRQIPPKDVPR